MRKLCVLIMLVFAAGYCESAQPTQPRFKAVAFDYFVLFDANSILPTVEKEFPGKGQEFVKTWRSKQFEYGFLRSITHQHKDFLQVTEDALIYTAALLKLELSPSARERLLQAYLTLKPWPDAADGLRRLRAAGVKIITIANFSPKMLQDNAANAGITNLFDELLSTEVNGTYKPEPAAYALGISHLHLKKEEIVFAAFGGWDAYGAKSYGYTTYWVNRFHLPTEQLGAQADQTSDSMEGLLRFVLGNGGLAAETTQSVAASSATASLAHYSYPPPVPPSPYPLWWQKTARFIRYWAEAFGSSAATVFNHLSTAQNQ